MSKIDIAFYEDKFDDLANFVPIRSTKSFKGESRKFDRYRRKKDSRISKQGKINKKTGVRYVRA